ncbi:Uncharacterized protein SCF082_LOCUS38014, partial [Durusdinium trenchii]
ADAFQLVKQRVDYDLRCLAIFRGKLSSHESALHHAQLTHRKQAFEASLAAAKKLLASNVKMLQGTRFDVVLRDFSNFSDQFCKTFGLQKESTVVISLLNWASICRVNQDRQLCQTRLLAMLLNGDSGLNHLSMVILPQFGYQKGQLWVAEHHCLKSLSNAGLNVDKTFTLQFSARLDQRDTRPLNYHGRILTSLGMQEKSWLFRNSALVRNQRTEPADQLPSNQMVFIEDLQPDAVPVTTDIDGLVAGAKKFEQLGPAAYKRVLEAALDGVTLPPKAGIIVLDASLTVGDSFEAFMQIRHDWQVPSAYVGLCEDPVSLEWFEKTRTQALAKQHLEGTVSVPGCVRMPAELPQEHRQAAPAPPVLNLLVGGGPDKSYPIFPEAL